MQPRGAAQLGISFRPLQAAALGLDPDAALQALLAYPFQVIRLGAYWNRLEPNHGDFRPGELDRQLDAAERAGKQVIVCLGAVKTFGYPEFFVPGHYLAGRCPRAPWSGRMSGGPSWTALLRSYAGSSSGTGNASRSSPGRSSTRRWTRWAWSTPGGWPRRSSAARSKRSARRTPASPLMNGFLATSAPVALQQWWRTRDQGDSLAVARRLGQHRRR